MFKQHILHVFSNDLQQEIDFEKLIQNGREAAHFEMPVHSPFRICKSFEQSARYVFWKKNGIKQQLRKITKCRNWTPLNNSLRKYGKRICSGPDLQVFDQFVQRVHNRNFGRVECIFRVGRSGRGVHFSRWPIWEGSTIFSITRN